jgi:ketosteroid isomerase-like protein
MESATSHRIATVERVFELFNRLPGDPVARRASPETDRLLGLFDEDVVFTQPAMQPEGAQYFKGREQLRESWDRWFEVWEYHRSFPDLIDERGNRVLALSENRFRGRDGIELVQKGAAIFTFDGPAIVRLDGFFDQEAARREFADERSA